MLSVDWPRPSTLILPHGPEADAPVVESGARGEHERAPPRHPGVQGRRLARKRASRGGLRKKKSKRVAGCGARGLARGALALTGIWAAGFVGAQHHGARGGAACGIMILSSARALVKLSGAARWAGAGPLPVAPARYVLPLCPRGRRAIGRGLSAARAVRGFANAVRPRAPRLTAANARAAGRTGGSGRTSTRRRSTRRGTARRWVRRARSAGSAPR